MLADLLAWMLAFIGSTTGEKVKPPPDPGALVDVAMVSTVGVLLDEVPSADRDAVEDELLDRDDDFWTDRARLQVHATEYRLVFRDFFYDNKKQLPLPPTDEWEIYLLDAPHVTTINGHDPVAVDYVFHSILVTGTDQPKLSDKKLKNIGGVVSEPFKLPADPDLLFDRTGYACMDEDGFPDNSVDPENALEFYDQDCTGDDEFCHHTFLPGVDCTTALKDTVGKVKTDMFFTRLAWSDSVAALYREGVQEAGVADAQPVQAKLEENRVAYKYFPEDSCALVEGCVGGSGWRRLLQFTAGMQNLGSEDLFVGDVSDPSSPIITHNLVEFSACHEHYHFDHYGNFDYDGAIGGKRAFCVESTARYFNNEDTPLTHDYSCDFQGTAAGWGDDYIAGIDCQWIDVTDLDPSLPQPIDLQFEFNPDGFLCEGDPILDSAGNLTFEPTSFVGENGLPQDRIACNEAPGGDANNSASIPVSVGTSGGYVTSACSRGQIGPNRDCGLTEQSHELACTPGAELTLSCTLDDCDAESQVVRVCESSVALDAGTACATPEALANGLVTGSDATEFTFTCPAARDAVEVGGEYALYTGALVAGHAGSGVTCTVE